MIGERVKHAREFCDITQVELGSLADLPQSRISDIETSRVVDPNPEDVERIARGTGFPVSFFYRGALPDLPDGNFRKLKRGKVRATRQLRAQVRQIVEIVQEAESVVVMPPVRLKPIASRPDIERLADEVRREAGVGSRDPIPVLTRAIERAGVVVVGLPGEIPDHYGYSAWPDFGFEGRPIIAFSQQDPGDRQRFTLAHELGHLLMHSRLREPAVDERKAEKEASRFAGALLLPKEAAIEAMKPPVTLTTLANVKATYGASIAMCAQRALDLSLIDHERFVSFRKQLSGRGWLRDEPVEVPQEKPLLIRKVLDALVTGDTIMERAAAVHLPPFAFRSIAS